MDDLATRLRDVFNARDVDGYRALFAEDARWGDPHTSDDACRSRADIIAFVKQLLAEGVRATIVEVEARPLGVACALDVQWPGDDPDCEAPERIFQAYIVHDGLVTEIQGHEDWNATLDAVGG